MEKECTTIGRQTKYCTAIFDAIDSMHHATNAQLHDVLLTNFPNISATTIHRATARLAEKGKIAIAPCDKKGCLCYDKNTLPHDHFQCDGCGKLVDIDVIDTIKNSLSDEIKGCCLSGRIVIKGTCKKCN